MNILIALIPALGWGIFSLIAGKIKNSHPANELMGLGTGALIIGIITAIIHPTSSNITIFFVITNFWNVLCTWTIWSIHFNEKYRYQ